MSSGLLIILVVLIIFAVVGAPQMGYHSYGWGPTGIVGVMLIIVVVLLLMGRL